MSKRAAGFVILRRLTEKVEYLMLRAAYGNHHWTPPKGHVDPGEDDFTTALRETKEEAGYGEADLRIFRDIHKTLEYRVNDHEKTVVYWLAELVDVTKAPTLSEEHEDLKWLSKEDAIRLCGYKDFAELLEEFHGKYAELLNSPDED